LEDTSSQLYTCQPELVNKAAARGRKLRHWPLFLLPDIGSLLHRHVGFNARHVGCYATTWNHAGGLTDYVSKMAANTEATKMVMLFGNCHRHLTMWRDAKIYRNTAKTSYISIEYPTIPKGGAGQQKFKYVCACAAYL
jgi:hypothetical protein